ncbi:cation diffusion facilitator family transporter [Aestuariimicrobium sp. p3-SID1156]|uniref:cation diffusion facilitator family transporter n=1 Tax=Aestuariimicrobium sp. p3-SID1156 TaxID=2916038 RepID=UPI00223C0CB5|nr:cation diffusion facilitator family transporter [Aestuariimicrobium sp. p3-SID1156]MCT1460095.1 cation diffusion facilitator family transporter [Aestuariimicrobium sp. p3-SID1156]
MEKKAEASESQGGESLLTVLIALAANALIAVAKTVAAMLSGSASMVAEASHSWADTGNEMLLLVAEKRAQKEKDASHPLGYGREAYVWSMIAAFGLFTAGSILSITHGISELRAEGGGEDYTISYIVLAIAFVLEGISFAQAVRQTRTAAQRANLRPLRFIMDTSQTTLRAVFFEDFAALLGILLAGGGLWAHQLTGNAVYDAIGSILVGILLGVVAIILIWRNLQFLVGQSVSPVVRARVLRELLEHPSVDRVTFLHLEYVGPSRVLLVAAVDLSGDERETVLQGRLQALEDRLMEHPMVELAIVSLSAPGKEALTA